MVDRELQTKESILQSWVGNWVELHYAASSAEVTPHGEVISGPAETRTGTYRLEAADDRGIEAFIPDPDESRMIFVPSNSILLIRGPSHEELERERSERAEEGGPPHNRQELMDRLAGAQTESEVADAIAAADDWLAEHPSDGDVRVARDHLRKAHHPSDEDLELEEGNPT